MGGAVSAGENNDDLIDNLVDADYIKSPAVEQVFRAVDRGHYFTPEFRNCAYKDLAWKSGNLHLSAPCIYSEVMEGLCLSSGLSFLNLGSGTGYLSTMAGLILGPYGINHGIEIHEDVIQYAVKKLEEFKRTSSSIDEYEFCEPKFINGNCLNLTSDAYRYDRVYCGAECPEYCENYMKNLLKIGGILVMPLNDQLLQITRTTEKSWSARTILPVSFAPLLESDPNAFKEPVFLPVLEPITLQDACRSSIRTILRRNVEIENPFIKTRRAKQAKKKMKETSLQRFVIPIFEESDDENFGDEEFGTRDLGRGGYIDARVQRPRTGQITAVIELARSLAMQEPVFGETRDAEDTSTAEQNNLNNTEEEIEDIEHDKDSHGVDEGMKEVFPENMNILKDGKDVVMAEPSENNNNVEEDDDEDDDDDEEEEEDDDEDEDDCDEDEQDESDEDDNSDNELAQVGSHAHNSHVCNGFYVTNGLGKYAYERVKSDSGIGDEIENGKGLSSGSDHEDRTCMEIDSDSDFSDVIPSVKRTYHVDNGQDSVNRTDECMLQEPELPLQKSIRRKIHRSKDPSVKKETVDGESDDKADVNSGKTSKRSSKKDVNNDPYSIFMRLKIQELPLPPTLKDFLNYYRKF